jgi:hypothetical protein
MKKSAAGLPDGLFSNQKFQFGKTFSGYRFGKCWYISWTFGTFYGHLGYFMTIWYTVCSFGTFFPVLVSCTNENLATLERGLNLEPISWHLTMVDGDKSALNFFHAKSMHQVFVDKVWRLPISVVNTKPYKSSAHSIVLTRVARWCIFKPKIQIWVNFGRSCNGRCSYLLVPFCLFYGQMLYFMAIL